MAQHRYSFVAFDQRVQGPGAAVTVYSNVAQYEALGLFDQLALDIVAQEVVGSGNPTLTVVVSHSADGRWWLPKFTAVDAKVLDPNGENPYVAFDDGTVPSLRFVRLEVTVSGLSAVAAHVQINATVNDVRETMFAARMRKLLDKQTKLESEGCTHVLQGGTQLDPTEAWQWDLTYAGKNGVVPAANAGYIVHDDEGNWYVADGARLCRLPDGKVQMSKPGQTVEVDLSQRSNQGAPGAC